MSAFMWMFCANCKRPLRVPRDPEIDVVACQCGYYTAVPK